MEPDRREDQASERQPTERAEPHEAQSAFNPPFGNDGLELVRDSHC
jgi:hypothetical protein